MKTKNSFYSWLALKTQTVPSAHVDSKILAYSSQYFQKEEKSFFNNWKLSGALSLTAAVVVVVMINKNQPAGSGPVIITEAPEMILHYNDMELMADASQLSDADWARIATQK